MILMALRVCSYNCFSIRKRIDCIRDILSSVDILVCQEIILLEEDCHALQKIDKDFNVYYVPSHLASTHTGDGRPIGGLAAFYRKSMQVSNKLSHQNFQVLSVPDKNDELFIINVYLPTNDRSAETTARYQLVLGEIQNCLDNIPSNRVILVGDFNADHIRKTSHWSILEEFISHNCFQMNDSVLPADTFTFLSPAHNTTHWLDHILSASAMEISNISICYKLALYDHFPIQFEVAYSKCRKNNSCRSIPKKTQSIRWNDLKKTAFNKQYNDAIK